MRPRTAGNRKLATIVTHLLVFRINPAPGPGTYDNLNQFNANGRYAASNFQNANARSFKSDSFAGPKKNVRIPSSANGPGPAQYDLNSTTMSNRIDMTNGRHGNAAKKVGLGTAKRLTYFQPKSKNPGPGEYSASTAFGQYISKYAKY